MKKHLLVVGIIFIFVFSSVPITFGYNVTKSSDEINIRKNIFLNHNKTVFSTDTRLIYTKYDNQPQLNKNFDLNSEKVFSNNNIDAAWPMYCHDIRNTGRSPYSTANTTCVEKWRFDSIAVFKGSPIIDGQGIIYIGSLYGLHAVFPNGTLKWEFLTEGVIVSAPAIDENGILYFGVIWDNKLQAIYSENGTVKWKYKIGPTWASPTIGPDGIIYAPATDNWNVLAFFPNGTLKWKFHANERVFSSPAIADDGTIYCTSYGGYLYALYPNNGTVKWKYKTGGIRTSPCINDEGMIYVVSYTGPLYAFYPNGTLKWSTNVGGGTSPTIGQDGTVYCGYSKLYAVNPTDGSIKWSFDVQGKIREATPCNSVDGTIYLGNYDGSDIVAVNPDGTEKWRKSLYGDIVSAPAISEDGVVYIGSQPLNKGYLHAFGESDEDAPSAPDINGPLNGTVGKDYDYTFKSTSPLGRDVYYWIEWGDGAVKKWDGPYSSGEVVTYSHTWSSEGTYTIKARAKDTDNLWGPWGELKVYMPRDKSTNNVLFWRMLESFPLLQKLLFSL